MTKSFISTSRSIELNLSLEEFFAKFTQIGLIKSLNEELSLGLDISSNKNIFNYDFSGNFDKDEFNNISDLVKKDGCEVLVGIGDDSLDFVKIIASYLSLPMLLLPSINSIESKESSLIQNYLNEKFIKSKWNKDKNTSISKVAVLGAGVMGSGIVYQNVVNGCDIVLKDINEDAITQGKKEVINLLNYLSPEKEHEQIINKISSRTDYSNMTDVDLVIEAVTENPIIKFEVLKAIEENTNDKTIITTNTSSISIDILAQTIKDPTKFCGMHFFNPIPIMPLIEIIRGKETSEETINIVANHALSIGKIPLVVNNCPGFFVNRALFNYCAGLNELVLEGVDYRLIDEAMEQFGWSLGPAYFLDSIGLDTAVYITAIMSEGYPDRMKVKRSIIEELVVNGNLGQKNKIGFYRYEEVDGMLNKIFDPDILHFINTKVGKSKELSLKEITDRMMIPVIIEAVRCLEEKIVSTPQEADIGLIYGMGFPFHKAGAFRYLDTFGLDKFIKKAENYKHLGKRYHVTKSMLDMASRKEKYYS